MPKVELNKIRSKNNSVIKIGGKDQPKVEIDQPMISSGRNLAAHSMNIHITKSSRELKNPNMDLDPMLSESAIL